MSRHYPTDLTDPEWERIRGLIPPARPGGRPRTVDLREVVNTLLYQRRSGCQWDMLPRDLLPRSTVHQLLVRWRADGTWRRIVAALGRREGTGPSSRKEPLSRP